MTHFNDYPKYTKNPFVNKDAEIYKKSKGPIISEYINVNANALLFTENITGAEIKVLFWLAFQNYYVDGMIPVDIDTVSDEVNLSRNRCIKAIKFLLSNKIIAKSTITNAYYLNINIIHNSLMIEDGLVK